MLFEDGLELEKVLNAFGWRSLSPGLECRVRCLDGAIDILSGRQRTLLNHLAGRRIDDVDVSLPDDATHSPLT